MKAETTYNAILGRVIAQLREEKGISRDEMCKELKVSVSTWSRIERGEASGIPTDQLTKIADALETTPGELFQKTDKVHKKLKESGWEVHNVPAKKISTTAKAGIALVGLAALTGFVVNALADKKDDKDDKDDKN